MPRYRKLHVKTRESLDMNDMPDDFTRLLWVLLPLGLCREGRGVHHPAWIKSKVFPLRFDVTEEMITAAFGWCIERGMVVPYEVDERSYFYVPTFHKYQGNTIKEAESNYPPPPDLLPPNSEPSPDQGASESGTDTHADTNTHADTDSDTTTPTNAATAPDAVAAVDPLECLTAFGMHNPETVLSETGLSPPQIVDTVRYAEDEGLGAGWVRTQLRENTPYQPRAPDDGAARRRSYAGGAYADYVES